MSVQSFIRSKTYEVYDMCNHVGFWRSLLLRYSARTDQLCVLLVVGNPYAKSTPKAEEAELFLTESIKQEIDSLMHELLNTLQSSFSCLASFNYQMSILIPSFIFSFTGLSNPGSDCPTITLHGNVYELVSLRSTIYRGKALQSHLPSVSICLLPG